MTSQQMFTLLAYPPFVADTSQLILSSPRAYLVQVCSALLLADVQAIAYQTQACQPILACL